MKQRLVLAQALMEKPSLLILDEPLNGIDEDTSVVFRKMLKEKNQKEKVTILLTSHNKEDIKEMCSRVYRIVKRDLVEEFVTVQP